MIIKNILVKNEQIEIFGNILDLRSNGIYKIVGENGIGKTSLIKQILFGKNEVEFTEEGYDKIFREEKYKLLTYMAQDVISYSCTIRDYVCKGRVDINDAEIVKYMSFFNIEYLGLNDDFQRLSGGEQIKICIITALLKNTPLLFLDEPSNNLDDDSVALLCEVLEEHSLNHTIVLVTHDTRMNFNNVKLIEIDGDKILQEKNKFYEENKLLINEYRISKMKLYSSIILHPLRFITLLIIIIAVFVFGLYIEIDFQKNISMSTVSVENIVTTYKVDEVFSDLNEVYCAGENISVPTSLYHNVISYNDIKDIVEIDGVSNILLIDDSYVNEFYDKEEKGSLLKNLTVISEPEIISSSVSEYSAYGLTSDIVLEGRLPKDNCYEVAASTEVLNKYYSFTDTDVKNFIGKKIKVLENEYEIVGITYIDACIVSYNDRDNFGYYSYRSDTYEDFVLRNRNYKHSVEVNNSDFTTYTYIFTYENQERSVLNALMKRYPGENYYSDYYNKIWVKTFNNRHLKKVYALSTLTSIVIGLLYFILSRKIYDVIIKKIADYKNYYLNGFSFSRYFYISYLFEFFILTTISIILSSIYSDFTYIKNQNLVYNIIIISIPMFVYIILQAAKKEKKDS